MRALYFDCFRGAAGDMIVGALVDLGVDPRAVRRTLSSLNIPGLRVTFRSVERGALRATRFEVRASGPQPHRGLRQIRRILRDSDLTPAVRRVSEKVFHRLCAAEAEIHRMPVEKVHLHEVGAVDAIADVVAAAYCLDWLAPSRIVVSPLPTGSGSVDCEHGTLPIPSPATLKLLEGCPVYGGDAHDELITPTGAAILTTVASSYGPMPAMRLLRSGHGAGSRQDEGLPNVVRVMEGELGPTDAGTDDVVVLEASIDDMNPQVYGHLRDRLADAGALEVYYTPVHMKKDRPGIVVTAIGREESLPDMREALFRETTTIGVRCRSASRWELARRTVRTRTPYGPIAVKVSYLDGDPVQIQPEYEDCRAAALRHEVPLREVQRAAVEAHQGRRRKKPS